LVDSAGLANDPRGLLDPDGLQVPANMEFTTISVRGWPYVFIRAVRDIEPYQELLVDYNNAYWTGEVSIKRRALDAHFAELGRHLCGFRATNPISLD